MIIEDAEAKQNIHFMQIDTWLSHPVIHIDITIWEIAEETDGSIKWHAEYIYTN